MQKLLSISRRLFSLRKESEPKLVDEASWNVDETASPKPNDGNSGIDIGEIFEKIREVKEKGLKKLDLSEKNLRELPAELFELEHLERLYLDNNELTEIPGSVVRLRNLTELDLEGNQLRDFPESITFLERLDTLNLGKNQITHIPSSISSLRNLFALRLHGNSLTEIPEAIFTLERLDVLSLKENPFTVKIDWATTPLQKLTAFDLKRSPNNHDRLGNQFNQSQKVEEITRASRTARIDENNDEVNLRQELPSNPPTYEWNERDNLHLYYVREPIHEGIITQFISELHRWHAEYEYIWKEGVVLNKDGSRAEVIVYCDSGRIEIRAEGTDRKELLIRISHELNRIRKFSDGSKYVPCNCQDCKNDPHLFPYSVLRNYIEVGRNKIECYKGGNNVEVIPLIDVVGGAKETEPDGQVFISYKWGGRSQRIAERLERALWDSDIPVIRDRTQMKYKDKVENFMKRMGRGKCVIAVISEEYLKSDNCMFELVEIVRNGHFYDRIFPIVLENANIYDRFQWTKYVEFWEQRYSLLEDAVKRLSLTNIEGLLQTINQFQEIRNTIVEIISILADMNTYETNNLDKSDVDDLVELVKVNLSE